MSASNAGASGVGGSLSSVAGCSTSTGWDGVDIEEYSRKYARALRHASRNNERSSRPGLGLGATGATVTTGMLAAVFMVPGASAEAVDGSEDQSATEQGGGMVAGTFGEEDSWAEFEAAELEAAGELDRQPGAASRAKYRMPIEVSACLPTEAANGARQMVRQQATYMPLREGTFTFSSPYGFRVHPTLGVVKLHEGADMSAPLGTPIYAPADGVVTKLGSSAGEGDYVVIQHTMSDGAVFSTRYLHQYASQIPVSEGQEVTAGSVIGYVGNSGRSTGPHLHFEVLDTSDAAIDPMGWLDRYGAVYVGQGC